MFDELLTFGWAGLVMLIWIGLAIGSFLNVVIYRLPVMLNRQWDMQAREQLAMSVDDTAEPFNLLVPRSLCPDCGHKITARENIPVVSWLLLKRKCAGCGAAISSRYPIVELVTGIMTVAVIATFGFTWLGAAALGYTYTLIALTYIDFDTQLLPDQMTLPLVWAGLAVNLFGAGMTDIQSAIVGAIAAYLFLWSTFWAFKLVTGKEGMGYGDFKLYAAIGAWLGWQVLPAVILIAAIAGLVFALASMITKKLERDQPISFGPFLAVAGWIALMWRNDLLTLFLVN